MAYLALYRKYRPANFSDLIGQKEIVDVIKNEIINNKLSHAYLFSGPRGTGKTSTAKIIARMINCKQLGEDGTPCGCCESCLNFSKNSDIVEIDAASNNGVDEIRELRDKVNLVPTYGNYKIYIIDEVHMLTTQAFNALLKTLEEPPSHVVFILATTEFYKIPITVVSRCQKFQFLKFSMDEIVERLKYIATQENISANDDVLYEISRLADGGLRDAINMLDQLSAFKNETLTVDDVYRLNGVISYLEYKNLLHFIVSNNIVELIHFMDEVDKNGKSFDRFIEDLIGFLNDILIYKTTSVINSKIPEKTASIEDVSNLFSEEQLYDLIISLNDLSVRMKNSSFVKILLISELIRYSNTNFKEETKVSYDRNNKSDDNALYNNKIIDSQPKINLGETKNEIIVSDKLKKIRINNAFATASKVSKESFTSKWGVVKDQLSRDAKYISIAGMMTDVEILVVGDLNVIFLAQYDSLLERLFSQISIIEQLLYEVYQIKYKIVFLLEDEWLYEKNQYISNLKSGKKYEYIEEEDLVLQENSIQFSENQDSDVDKIISLLGENVISYE